MPKSKMVSNAILLLVAGIIFPGFMGLNGSGSTLDKVIQLFTAQFSFAGIGVMLNPTLFVAAVAIFTAIFCRDSAAGRKFYETSPAWFKRIFGTLSVPMLALGVSAIAGLVFQTLNSNWWSVISLFTMVQILLFVGMRSLRETRPKSPNA
jgi:membrane protein implicated in regulation of membrane protease activity